ncbi:nickel pincer cofactor biosynthesis protein LarB [Benzoatithermus flavus]|uniref:Nickel pincer cofactor biosynthesis protein LarB n=1 Tax=Benzoatithermus flavus TaxID=3108223 RepID=A0ABU8XZJ6_9PROT
MAAGFTFDWKREARTGVSEAVLCTGKTPAQIDAILAEAAAARRRLLLTRLDRALFESLDPAACAALDYDPLSRTAILGDAPPERLKAAVGIVCAGTSDLPVAEEARRTLAFHGVETPDAIADVGVAGLWRLMERLPELRACRVVIAVAGLEGALFSVLAGLIEGLVIAVPRSVGYGVAAGGHAALNAALASCAPGVVVVNIDNGFGAACAALKIVRGMDGR